MPIVQIIKATGTQAHKAVKRKKKGTRLYLCNEEQRENVSQHGFTVT